MIICHMACKCGAVSACAALFEADFGTQQSAAAAVRLGSALACARVLGHTDLHVVVIAASTDAATPLVTRQLG